MLSLIATGTLTSLTYTEVTVLIILTSNMYFVFRIATNEIVLSQ